MTEIKDVNLVKLENGAIVTKKYILLTAITKSLLFNKIIDTLEPFSRKHKMKIYALPVVQLNFQDMTDLSGNLERV